MKLYNESKLLKNCEKVWGALTSVVCLIFVEQNFAQEKDQNLTVLIAVKYFFMKLSGGKKPTDDSCNWFKFFPHGVGFYTKTL